MSSSHPAKDWKTKIQRLTDEILVRSDFINAAQKVNKEPDILFWVNLSPKFGFHPSTYRYVMHYLRTGETNPDLISPPVTLVSEIDETISPSDDPHFTFVAHEKAHKKWPEVKRLYLELTPGVKRTDIANFLISEASVIDEKLRLLSQSNVQKPIRLSWMRSRDEKIFNASKTQSVKEIAETEGISESQVRKIIKKLRIDASS